MLDLVIAGGWVMVAILACSVIALAIVGERLWALGRRRVLPPHLVAQAWRWATSDQLDQAHLRRLRESSPLGRVLAAALVNRHHPREIMKEAVEDTGRHVAHELERYLNTLGTIAGISPLLGLLGTVLGMIKVFTTITTQGVGDPGALAGGISEALITTAAGLVVAIPSLMFYRYLRRRVDELVVRMEEEALKLVEALAGQREREEDAA